MIFNLLEIEKSSDEKRSLKNEEKKLFQATKNQNFYLSL